MLMPLYMDLIMFVAMIVVVSMQLMNYIHILFLIVNLTHSVGIAVTPVLNYFIYLII